MPSSLEPELVSGFVPIDDQHRRIFARLQVAREAAKAGDLPAAKRSLQALGDELIAHFAAEESFMAAALYPERGRHKTAHDLFMQDFVQLTREIDTIGLTDPTVLGITTRVPEWFAFHIRVNDLPLGRYLTSRRFKPDARTGPTGKPSTSS